jgi:hypothetical protein
MGIINLFFLSRKKENFLLLEKSFGWRSHGENRRANGKGKRKMQKENAKGKCKRKMQKENAKGKCKRKMQKACPSCRRGKTVRPRSERVFHRH